MNPSLDPITSFPVLDNCSFYVWIKKARFPSLIFLWLLLQFFVFSKTYHLHQSFCSPDHEDFSQGWATSYTFFTLHLHLPAIKKKRKAKQNNKPKKTKNKLCVCSRDKRVGGEPWANFIMKSAEEKAQRVWKQQVLAVEGKLAGLCWGPSEGEERRNMEWKEADTVECYSMSPQPLVTLGISCFLCWCCCFSFYFRIILDIKIVKIKLYREFSDTILPWFP